MNHRADSVDESLALVCNVPDVARGERRVSVMSIIELSKSIREIDNGVALHFDGSTDTAKTLFDFVLAERQCCAQFTYSMSLEPRATAIELRVTANEQLIRPLKTLYLGLTEQRPEA